MIKKAVVTGASGFIGSALVNTLLGRGVTVYGVDISRSLMEKFSGSGSFIAVEAGFEDYGNLSGLIKDEIDVFYHLAWQGGFASDSLKNYRLQLENSIASCEAAEQAIKMGCRKFVFAGTCNEFELIPFICSDGFKPRYTCVYSAAKLAAELIGKTYAFNNSMEFCGGLIAMSYGENNKARTLPNIVIRQLLNKISPKLIEGNNLYDMIYINDIAEAFVAIGEKGRNMKSYYVGHRYLKTFREIMTDIRDILDPSAELMFGAFKDTASMDYSHIDLDALYNDTGFECQSDFRESILKTAEWVKTLNWE